MKITRENTDKGYVLIRVVVEPADYEKTVADKLRDYRLKAALPGFRPGKVPSSLIHKKFAKPVIAEEVNNLLSHNLTNYLRDENMAILGDPLPDPDHQKPINWLITALQRYQKTFQTRLCRCCATSWRPLFAMVSMRKG